MNFPVSLANTDKYGRKTKENPSIIESSYFFLGLEYGFDGWAAVAILSHETNVRTEASTEGGGAEKYKKAGFR